MLSLSFPHPAIEHIPFFSGHKQQLYVLRADAVDPVISGNKWFKLRYYLSEALQQQKTRIVTYGGAFSNHIVAAAAACQAAGLACTGIIRGEEPAILSHSLQQARHYGMQLQFVTRQDYAAKTIPAWVNPDTDYLIAEGGYGKTGAAGAATLLDGVPADFTHILCAVGTGTTLAGLLSAAPATTKVIGISSLKNNTALEQETAALTNKVREDITILHDYHFGGYAKQTPALIGFMNELYRQTGIPTDIVYTGKLFYACKDLLDKNYFAAGSKILLIHSGGLQGNLSLPKGTLIY
jgi:1-aminocyclopropane-1-carboxylate deaminase